MSEVARGLEATSHSDSVRDSKWTTFEPHGMELESGCRAGDGGRWPDAEGGAGKGMKEHEFIMRQSSMSLSRSGAVWALDAVGDDGGGQVEWRRVVWRWSSGRWAPSTLRDQNESKPRGLSFIHRRCAPSRQILFPPPLRVRQPPNRLPARARGWARQNKYFGAASAPPSAA
jgi:hypothetical protein